MFQGTQLRLSPSGDGKSLLYSRIYNITAVRIDLFVSLILN